MKQYKNDKLDLETKVEIPLALVAENLTMGKRSRRGWGYVKLIPSKTISNTSSKIGNDIQSGVMVKRSLHFVAKYFKVTKFYSPNQI